MKDYIDKKTGNANNKATYLAKGDKRIWKTLEVKKRKTELELLFQ